MLPEEARRKIIESRERFPDRKSAILPALHIVQESCGYLTNESMDEVARLLDMPHSDVGGVATFYSMFFERPVGKYQLDVCTTLSCSLLGAEHLVDYLSRKLGIRVGETTPDGVFTLRTVECLGDCGRAPVMMVGDRYYDDLTPEKLDGIIDELRDKAGG
jgi:NADH-quinone oxidoreductase subunit E